MATKPRRLSAVDLPTIPVDDPTISGYELVDGELLPVSPSGLKHSDVAGEVYSRMKAYVREQAAGKVWADAWCRLRLPHDTERVRAPDVAFVSNAALARRGNFDFLDVLPELVVEVYSPTNQKRPGEFQRRVRDFIDAGVPLLWVIYPEAGYALVHRPDGSARMLREDDALDGEEILPGFRLVLRELLEAE